MQPLHFTSLQELLSCYDYFTAASTPQEQEPLESRLFSIDSYEELITLLDKNPICPIRRQLAASLNILLETASRIEELVLREKILQDSLRLVKGTHLEESLYLTSLEVLAFKKKQALEAVENCFNAVQEKEPLVQKIASMFLNHAKQSIERAFEQATLDLIVIRNEPSPLDP